VEGVAYRERCTLPSTDRGERADNHRLMTNF
jgi:hypothetical protein